MGLDIIGWLTQGGPVCLEHKPLTKEQDARYDRLMEAKEWNLLLKPEDQAFLDEMDSLIIRPIYGIEIATYWSDQDHAIRCVRPGCQEQEILEPDREYADHYQILTEKIIGYRDSTGQIYCIECANVAKEEEHQLAPILLTDEGARCLKCSYKYCFWYEDHETIFDALKALVARFAKDWGRSHPALAYYREQGLLDPIKEL